MKTARLAFALVNLLLLSSCTTPPGPTAITPATELPEDVPMNADAGRGSWLIVTLRLENGRELPFVVDTGAEGTLLDQSLEPLLGRPVRPWTLWVAGAEHQSSLFAAPELYLGNTRLETGRYVATYDIEAMLPDSSRRIMGVLGMDCLRHYCIQLDFQTGKLRFLDSARSDKTRWGNALPLATAKVHGREADYAVIHSSALVGGEPVDLLVDTGCNTDGLLQPALFRQALQENRDPGTSPSVKAEARKGLTACFSECIWHGHSFTNLFVQESPNNGLNAIGLRFLARHRVTFDLPNNTLYLKHTSVGPLPGDTLVEVINRAIKSTADLLENLRKQGRLPGWEDEVQGRLLSVHHLQGESHCQTFNYRKQGDPSLYHYRLTRASENSPWKLQRAWQTDLNGHTLKEFPVAF